MCSADANLVDIGASPPQQPQVYNEHGIVTETPVVRHGYEEAIPDANQALDNTPVDYDDYAEYNDIHDGYTDYDDDDYADETPLSSASSPEDPEDQFSQEARGELRQRALEKAATALDNLFHERCACSMYNIAPSPTLLSNVMQPSLIAPWMKKVIHYTSYHRTGRVILAPPALGDWPCTHQASKGRSRYCRGGNY